MALKWLGYAWFTHDWGVSAYTSTYVDELNDDPPAVASHLRELAEDPEALANLAELMKEDE